MNDSSDLILCPLREEDIESVIQLAREELGRDLDPMRICALINDCPNIAVKKNDSLIAFAYSLDFAPDILQLANILVKDQYRSLGIGRKMIQEIEDMSQDKYSAIILINSSLYPNLNGKKRSAKNFYLRLGYRIIFESSNSKVFLKEL